MPTNFLLTLLSVILFIQRALPQSLTKLVPEFKVSTQSPVGSPFISALNDNAGFVITYAVGSAEPFQIYAQIHFLNGTVKKPQFKVNTISGTYSSISIATLKDDAGVAITYMGYPNNYLYV